MTRRTWSRAGATGTAVLLLLAAVAAVGRAGEERDGGAVPSERKAEIEALLAKLPDAAIDPMSGVPGAEMRHVGAFEAEQQLRRLLGDDRASWDLARPTLTALLAKTESTEVAKLALKVLLFDPSDAGPATAREHLKAHPDRFDTNLLVKALERGIAEAVPHLEKLCDVDPDRMLDAYPAAALAMRGKERGRKMLEAVIASTVQVRTRTDTYFAAATGLFFLGEKDAFSRAVALARPEFEKKLAGENGVYAAAWFALGIEYFHRAVVEGRPVSVAFMSWPVTDFIRARIDEYDSKEKVRALMDSM